MFSLERMKIEKVEKLEANLHDRTQSLEKTVENVRKYKDIKLVATERRRNYLVSKPNYHATKFFTENVLAIEIKKK